MTFVNTVLMLGSALALALLAGACIALWFDDDVHRPRPRRSR